MITIQDKGFSRSIGRRSLLLGATAVGAAFAAGGPAAFAQAPPTAPTSAGMVRGRWEGGVALFAGVPYGAPTGPGSRFMPPKPAAPWTDMRDATKPYHRAPQRPFNVFKSPVGDYFAGGRPDRFMMDDETASEDCLVLNVLTPAVDRGRRPVMVYIHGGGYTSGSGIIALGGDRLVHEQDVVLVSINHRLSSFGYLYLGELDPRYADSGNIGHLDLLLALQWVKANIASFGGDPANVTIWGESGGGSKISNLLNMPAAKGLFHKAIVASGSALKAIDRGAATANARKFIANLGLKDYQLGQLQSVSMEDMIKASQGLTWGPVVDGRTFLRDPFSPDASPLAAGVPLLIITDQDEATILAGEDPVTFTLTDDALQARVAKIMNVPPARADAVIAQFRRTRPGATQAETYFAIVTERTRANGIVQAERKAAQKNGPAYMAFFKWATPVGGGKYKAFHTCDLPLEFRIVRYPESEALSKRISAAWASYARTGHPTIPGGPAWPAYDPPRRATAVFDLNSTVIADNPRPDDYKVWSVA